MKVSVILMLYVARELKKKIYDKAEHTTVHRIEIIFITVGPDLVMCMKYLAASFVIT
jgi:hypothetical protein